MSNASLGDVRIMQGRAIIPIQLPVIPKMQRKLTRPMGVLFGQTPIITRTYGGHSLWAGTQLARHILGDPKVYELDDVLANWDNVGFEWNFKDNRLEAYLTKQGQTYKVLIPASKLKAIFEGTSKKLGLKKSCLCKHKGKDLQSMLNTTAKWLDDTAKLGGDPSGEYLMNTALAKFEGRRRKPLVGAPVYGSASGSIDANSMAQFAALSPIERAKRMAAQASEGAKSLQNRLASMSPQQRKAWEEAQAKARWRRKCSGGFDFECFVSDVGKELDKAATNVGKGVSSFFNDPGKWIQHAARDVGKFVDEVGMVALDVVSSPVFAGIAGVLSFIPPLNAVGGAALAASAAANAVKPALQVVSSVGKLASGDLSGAAGIPGVSSIVKGVLPALPAGTGNIQKAVDNAKGIVDGFKAGTVNLPRGPKKLVVAALQSQPAPGAVAIAAQQTPQGVSTAVYAPPSVAPAPESSIKAAIFKLPSPSVTLWNQVMRSLSEQERQLVGMALNEPLKGRNAWEAIYQSGPRSPLQLIRKGVKLGLKGTAGQQFASALRGARA